MEIAVTAWRRVADAESDLRIALWCSPGAALSSTTDSPLPQFKRAIERDPTRFAITPKYGPFVVPRDRAGGPDDSDRGIEH
jgi:hypothetical protein